MSDKDNTLICNSKKNCYFFSCPPVNHPVRHKDSPIITVLWDVKTYFREKQELPQPDSWSRTNIYDIYRGFD